MKVKDLMQDLLRNGLDLSFYDDTRSAGQFNKFLKMRLTHSNSLYEKRSVQKASQKNNGTPSKKGGFSAISEESKSEYDNSENKFNYGFQFQHSIGGLSDKPDIVEQFWADDNDMFDENQKFCDAA